MTTTHSAPPDLSERKGITLGRSAYREEDFPALRLVRTSRVVRKIAFWLGAAMVFAVAMALFTPWQQSLSGSGSVTEFDPLNRPQVVEAQVKGVIAEIGPGIAENAAVTKGQLIYRIVDQDPNYLGRIEQQLQNKQREIDLAHTRLESYQDHLIQKQAVVEATEQMMAALEAAGREAIAAADAYVSAGQNKLQSEREGLKAIEAEVLQTKLDFDRKQRLREQGIESDLKFQETELKYKQSEQKRLMAVQKVQEATQELEAKRRERDSKRREWDSKINEAAGKIGSYKAEVNKAQADIAKTSEELAKLQSDLLKSQTDVARQQQQEVRAPLNGRIHRLVAYAESTQVKPGDPLFEIVPETQNPAVQIWVTGNDAPLIRQGDLVRLQFEGWPAVQFVGWPSVAVGTFGGIVALVDPTDDGAGKFRVLITPDPSDQPWPEAPYLRQGVRANGWVLLKQVPLWFEIWRRMNGFPPVIPKDDAKSDDKPAKPPKVKV